jgi:hypothetical protein
VELTQVETEIENLLKSLSTAKTTLMSYVNDKIEELDVQRGALAKQIADLTADSVSPEEIHRVSADLENWDNLEFDDRRQVVAALISKVCATGENIQIEWKI